jgi:hypothetical protein
MQITHEFVEDSDNGRYEYDFGECSYANGYCQIDTQQDASYYGNWINLFERKAVCYAEGDLSRIDFDTDQEMADWLVQFQQNKGLGFLHIDPGLGEDLKRNTERCLGLGIGYLLPTPTI